MNKMSETIIVCGCDKNQFCMDSVAVLSKEIDLLKEENQEYKDMVLESPLKEEFIASKREIGRLNKRIEVLKAALKSIVDPPIQVRCEHGVLLPNYVYSLTKDALSEVGEDK